MAAIYPFLETLAARTCLVECDSARGAIVVLYENTGSVKRAMSIDGGELWFDCGYAYLLDTSIARPTSGIFIDPRLTQFQAQLLSISNDPRRGNLVMTVDIGGAKKVLESFDLGATWVVRLS